MISCFARRLSLRQRWRTARRRRCHCWSVRSEPEYALAHSHAAVCHEILFMRGRQADRREENRQGAIRHARAALVHGRDDATALAEAGFVIAMVEHDRAAAREAFEAATVLSPSSAFTYIMGSVVLGWAGEGDRAIEWAEKGLRLSPLDPWNFNAWFGVFAEISSKRATRTQRMRRASRSRATPASASRTFAWRRRS